METSLDQAIMALVLGAKKTGLSALLDLIPALVDASVCPKCAGARWTTFGPAAEPRMICFVCFGRGEVDERLFQRARERDEM